MATNTRREFLKHAAIGVAALAASPPRSVLGANDRVRVGMIGVGGRGEDLLKQVLQLPNAQLVAIADVYTRRRDAAKQIAPGIQTMADHRRLLDMKDIDAALGSGKSRAVWTQAIWCTMFSVMFPPENSQNRRQLMNL